MLRIPFMPRGSRFILSSGRLILSENKPTLGMQLGWPVEISWAHFIAEGA